MWSRPCQRLTLRATYRTVERHDSIALVLDRVRRNSEPTPVQREGFFHPFLETPRRTRIDLAQLPPELLQRRLGGGVVGHRVGVLQPPSPVRPAALRQMIDHVPDLVNLAALHFRLAAE